MEFFKKFWRALLLFIGLALSVVVVWIMNDETANRKPASFNQNSLEYTDAIWGKKETEELPSVAPHWVDDTKKDEYDYSNKFEEDSLEQLSESLSSEQI